MYSVHSLQVRRCFSTRTGGGWRQAAAAAAAGQARGGRRPTTTTMTTGAAKLPVLDFPFQLHVGSDIADVGRIRRILAKPSRAARFVERVLSADELLNPRVQRYLGELRRLHGHGSPPAKAAEVSADSPAGERELPGQTAGGILDEAAQFMSGRWAAKEAVMKAHPGRRLPFTAIEILTILAEPSDLPVAKSPPIDLPETNKSTEALPAGESPGNSTRLSGDESPGSDAEMGNEPPVWKPVPPVLPKVTAGLFACVTLEHHKQLMPVSISHSGGFAIATCIAPFYPHHMWSSILRSQTGSSYAKKLD